MLNLRAGRGTGAQNNLKGPIAASLNRRGPGKDSLIDLKEDFMSTRRS